VARCEHSPGQADKVSSHYCWAAESTDFMAYGQDRVTEAEAPRGMEGYGWPVGALCLSRPGWAQGPLQATCVAALADPLLERDCGRPAPLWKRDSLLNYLLPTAISGGKALCETLAWAAKRPRDGSRGHKT
jgi:hypothetical protein